MNRLFCTVGSVIASLLITACEPSTTRPPKTTVTAPHAADTVVYVGTRIPWSSLMRTDSGQAYSSKPTTRARIVDGTSNAIQLAGDSVFAVNPGVIVIEVRDDAAGWVTTFRIGSVYDLRRQWHFESLCRTEDRSTSDYTNTLTDFSSTGAATILNASSLDGRPHWSADGRPIVAAVVAGLSTDSVFHFYVHAPNHVYPDTTVITTSVVSFITADSSTNVQYTSPNGHTGTLRLAGVMSWSAQSAPICSSRATGSLFAFRARLDAL